MSIIVKSVDIEDDGKVITIKDDYDGGIDIIDSENGNVSVNIPFNMMDDFMKVVNGFYAEKDDGY